MVKDVCKHEKCRIYLEDDELEVEKGIYFRGQESFLSRRVEIQSY